MVGSATVGANRVRAGGRALLLLADPVNASILRLLARGALPVTKLQDGLGPTSRTTRFGRLRELEELGVIVRRKEGGSPPLTHCMLSPGGRNLLVVLRSLRRWVRERPNGVTGKGDLFGILETKALALGWNSTVLRWLAEQPCSLTALDAQSPPEVSYHDLRKARRALSDGGLIARVPSATRSRLYKPTAWGRRAAQVLAAAIRWERDFPVEANVEPTALEAEGLLMLGAAVGVQVPTGLRGRYVLRCDDLADASTLVSDGYAVSVAGEDFEEVNGEISGSLSAWLDVLAENRTAALRVRDGNRTVDLSTSFFDPAFPDRRAGAPRAVHGQIS